MGHIIKIDSFFSSSSKLFILFLFVFICKRNYTQPKIKNQHKCKNIYIFSEKSYMAFLLLSVCALSISLHDYTNINIKALFGYKVSIS